MPITQAGGERLRGPAQPRRTHTAPPTVRRPVLRCHLWHDDRAVLPTGAVHSHEPARAGRNRVPQPHRPVRRSPAAGPSVERARRRAQARGCLDPGGCRSDRADRVGRRGGEDGRGAARTAEEREDGPAVRHDGPAVRHDRSGAVAPPADGLSGRTGASGSREQGLRGAARASGPRTGGAGPPPTRRLRPRPPGSAARFPPGPRTGRGLAVEILQATASAMSAAGTGVPK
jgi:hypothetical protein